MYTFAYVLLVLSFLLSLLLSATAIFQIWRQQYTILSILERGWKAVSAGVILSALILCQAFLTDDFSLRYVAAYSDRGLAFFYKLTSFWAGQEGSLLFWACCCVVFGLFFMRSKPYQKLDRDIRTAFWIFYPAATAFLLLLISAYNNPFDQLPVPLQDGRGLIPLLRHPGMVFHPPLLFLGYSGFLAPGCLALAAVLTGGNGRMSPRGKGAGGRVFEKDIVIASERDWIGASMNFTRLAWGLLSAGIILGAWWAYMELGWSGYWSWDPVENASLVPWLAATAFIHTSILERRAGKLCRFNIVGINLVSITAFFATFITRGQVLNSVHGYPDGGVSTPLLVFICSYLLITILMAVFSARRGQPVAGLFSREGLLLVLSWILLALGALVVCATMWPVISRIWLDIPVALEAEFYNRVCLPLFVLAALLLVFCPWLSWEKGLARPGIAMLCGVVFVLCLPVFLVFMEGRPRSAQGLVELMANAQTLAQLGAAAAVAAAVSIFLRLRANKKNQSDHKNKHQPVNKVKNNLSRVILSAGAAHLGFVLIVFGVAFSGPYQSEYNLNLEQGQSVLAGKHTVRLDTLNSGKMSDYIYIQAGISLQKDGTILGSMYPERRLYDKYPDPFSEASALFSLGEEAYVNLLSIDPQSSIVRVRLTINPMVNWIWVGGILLSLAPLLVILARREETI